MTVALVVPDQPVFSVLLQKCSAFLWVYAATPLLPPVFVVAQRHQMNDLYRRSVECLMD
jgi:hypothetical protein